jgi:DNA-binding transcriptional MerR regulator/GGDEF domain-containing protein
MDERSKQRIREHLQQRDVQERIQRYIENGRAEATVTISRAAELFGFSENRLRDWEEHGLLNPLRPAGPKGRRLYTPRELDKLAIIRELLDSGYSPSDIPPQVDNIWYAHASSQASIHQPEKPASPPKEGTTADTLSINERIEQARATLFWRYFVSHALRMSLMLICEDIPHTTACLVLPLEQPLSGRQIRQVEDLSQLGESLIGWLGQSRSSQTLLASAPTFDYASDYRLLPLSVMTDDHPEETSQDSTLILLDRRSRRLTLTTPVVQTIRRLLQPIYEEVERARACFGLGMRDVLDPSTDLDGSTHEEDIILNGLAEIAVRLGGTTADGESRWHFCCILLPNYPSSVLSLQQRGLVVRAQSAFSPYKVGVTTLSPQGPAIGPCIRAFQSGHIISLPVLVVEDAPMLPHNEQPMRSAIAVPVEGQDGMSIAVIYVASTRPHAFSEDDQRLLRIIGNMVGERIETYSTRLRAVGKLGELITSPALVDTVFRDFLSENEFAQHVEHILKDILTRSEDSLKDVISFIALDIDNQSSLGNKFGDRMARDLSKMVGLRIQGQLRAFKEDAEYELYRINADRFYIMLKGMPLEQAQAKAELLRKVLNGSYQIDPLRAPIGQPTLPENMVTLSHITVRLGVSSYFYWKLREILQRYSSDDAVVRVRILLMSFLNEVLDIGKRDGGNTVISWDPHIREIIRYTPTP